MAVARPYNWQLANMLLAQLVDQHELSLSYIQKQCAKDELAQALDIIKSSGLELAQTATSIRLVSRPDCFDRQHLADEVGENYPLEHFYIIDSTNQYLLDHASRQPRACIADYQLSGRGRSQKRWHADFGKHLCISAAKTLHKQSSPGAVTLALGVEIAKYLENLGVKGVGIKWPNDIYVAGRKLCGILVEARMQGRETFWLVAGVGLNIVPPAAAVKQRAIGLRQILPNLPVQREQWARQLIEIIYNTLQRVERQGLAPFRADFMAYDLTRDHLINVYHNEKVERARGCGLAENGCLIVEIDGQRQQLYSAQVSLRLAEKNA